MATPPKPSTCANCCPSCSPPCCCRSRQPLQSLTDIKGTKWRSASFWHQDFLRNAGATPVTMPWGQGVYTALKDGALDGLMVNVDSGCDIKAHQAAPNVLVSKALWLGHVYLLVMKQDTWNGLTKEDQAAIQRAAASAYKTLGATMDSSFDAQLAELKKNGADVRVLSPQEVAQWNTTSRYRDVPAAWMKEQEGKGVKDAGATLKKLSTLMNEAMR